jgi:uncharacterized protein (DUF885 family)
LTTETLAADARLRTLIQDRFDALMATWPSHATYLGIHQHDGRLADLSREAKLADIAAERRFVGALEAIQPLDLGESDRFERDVALHSARLRLFSAEVERGWERRATAAEEVGDSLFLLLARDFAPLPERLDSMTQRLEAVPDALGQARSRMGDRPVRLWNELEVAAAQELPSLTSEIVAAGREILPRGSTELSRLEAAAKAANAALETYAGWVSEQLAGSTAEVALGRVDFDTLIGLRAFDGLDADDILAIGWEQLETMHAVRQEAGRLIDPGATESEIVDRVKSDGPADFDEALAAYRDAMFRARSYIAEHDLATLPADEVLEIIPTPTYMRSSIPLAAYFEPAAFDRPIRGVYIVTPSVDGGPGAMREHNWSSIVNTSVHEAYPGHHLQFSAALGSASPSRLLTEAPEFAEGWGMYCEQMMLDQGFEDSPERRVIVATDAIWRACRIILDIKLHRGEIGVDEAIEFLVKHTMFEVPVARAEVRRYTHTPGYNLSYLTGKVLIQRLRADEEQRLGDAFSLRGFHDALLYSGTLPISFHRRLLAGEGGGSTRPDALGNA